MYYMPVETSTKICLFQREWAGKCTFSLNLGVKCSFSPYLCIWLAENQFKNRLWDVAVFLSKQREKHLENWHCRLGWFSYKSFDFIRFSIWTFLIKHVFGFQTLEWGCWDNKMSLECCSILFLLEPPVIMSKNMHCCLLWLLK